METLASSPNRLAILPVQDSALEDADQSYFFDGFVLDLITELSRFSNIDIISPHSSFASSLQGLDDIAIADALGAQLALKSSVRKRNDSIRINAQLVELRTGSLLWAERYDAKLETLFSVQDTIVEAISAALPRRIHSAKLESARRKPVTELEAYDWWLRGMEKLRQGTLQGDEEARELFERALEKDPHFSRAYVGLSVSHFNEWSCQHWELSELSECRAFQYATKAYELDRDDSMCHIVLARVHWFRREFERTQNHIDRAFELNPNDADALVMIACSHAFLGEQEKAERLFERAIRLNPFCDSWYYAYGGFIQIMGRKFAEGIEACLKAPLTTVWVDLAAYLSIASAYLGNLDEAAAYRDVFLENYQEKITNGRKPRPGEAYEWLIFVNPFKKQEDADFYRTGLEMAGFAAQDSEEVSPAAVSEKSSDSEHAHAEPIFRVENELRCIHWEEKIIRLPEVKGFGDIEELLLRQGEEIHCTELMGSVSEDAKSSEVMDARARGECGERIRELQTDLAEARENNDFSRAEKIQEELDPLLDYLAKAVGIGGRSRRLAPPAERARSAVTWRIRNAIKKIEEAHVPAGRHFSNSIRTGTFCSYTPEKPVSWST